MLHVTNGTSVSLPAPGIAGDVLAWLDVLHEGPVPGGLDAAGLRRVRGLFLDAELPASTPAELELARRDAVLDSYDEITLWFEHDLYDQLQLIQILDWLSRRDPGGAGLSLIGAAVYLGTLRPGELLALYSMRQPVTGEQLALAERAWAAFSASDPRPLAQLIREDTSALPYLHGALLRHLEQFPSVRDGLSRSERQILEAVAAGASRAAEVFVADRAREERIFMGDTMLFACIRRLASGAAPLLEIIEPLGPFGRSKVALTPAGSAALRGEADAVRLNGIDRWLGGVHLREGQVWRWRAEDQALVAG